MIGAEEERVAGRLRLVGAALLVVMWAVFDPFAGWMAILIAGVAAGWTGYLEWAMRRRAEVPVRLHDVSLVLDGLLATTCYLVFLPDPDAIPPVLFPIVVFRLSVRYGRLGALSGVGVFGLAIVIRAVVKVSRTNGEVRPAVLVVWVLAAAATVALAMEVRRQALRRHAHPAPDPQPSGDDSLAARLVTWHDHAYQDPTLTRREWDVFELLGQGADCQQIARRLFVTVSTVRNHVHNMRVKLGLASREQLIDLAREAHRLRAAEPPASQELDGS
ncbi:helix-turn-helix transcriptional regulator [Amycolatopsis alkalitolerans]|uniref:Response regulator transcription factor n=1 Tax=Amycolatopsis alkalitolerans TaxID=2547244 RepID=A0A5C4M8C4_9PSEU|nr:LuxR C-terminal-related transcriptional regulator [Amycolatopsis alkalitolerans]TNC29727.1 response regulator transcription factor [Amycolatopsis alkalitolerans]